MDTSTRPAQTDPHLLHPEFRHLVRWSVGLWGETIREDAGLELFDGIERLRQRMKTLRGQSFDVQERELATCLSSMADLDTSSRSAVAKAFGFMLEIINAVENAYRTHRLRARPTEVNAPAAGSIIFVLTAHPTEARSPQMLELFREIQSCLLAALETGSEAMEPRLRHLLKLAWRIPVSRTEKPSVEDEAHYIYSTVLRPEIIDALLSHVDSPAPVFIRTWVGGDKDGHPGVNDKVMLNSLSASRARVLAYVEERLASVRAHLALIDPDVGKAKNSAHPVVRDLASIASCISQLQSVGTSDAKKVVRFYRYLESLERRYKSLAGTESPDLTQLRRLIKLFPGLVVPLELRESSELIRSALKSKSDPSAIVGMLKTLRRISGRGSVTWYARGLVVSMTESADDVIAALKLVRRELRGDDMRVIPLFESGASLTSASKILAAFLADPGRLETARKHWSNRFEVMVGYSDSAKELGSLPSRALIEGALSTMDECLRTYGLTPIFFHGSGGSVDRGGGSLEEQIAWWPESAIVHFKATIQGEMVQRAFASAPIINSQIEKISRRRTAPPVNRRWEGKTDPLAAFFGQITKCYHDLIHDSEFLELIEKATPYQFLDVLRFGSRPTKRSGDLKISGLRAIPWILCWTQTRSLIPAWWGIGSAWNQAGDQGRQDLIRISRSDPLLSSYFKLLSFTLSKVELGVFAQYLAASNLEPGRSAKLLKRIRGEYELTLECVRTCAGRQDLLWFRPWLGESIRLRSSMIHPLNLLQILALKSRDYQLLRETVTGVACGMMTTG